MAPMSPERRKLRAQVAAIRRHHPNRPDLVEQMQRDLKIARAEKFIREVVESPPALRPDELEKLRALLPSGGEPDVS